MNHHPPPEVRATAARDWTKQVFVRMLLLLGIAALVVGGL